MSEVAEGVQEVLERYKERFEQASAGKSRLSIFVCPDGERHLYPSEAHCVWARMTWARTAEEAEAIARKFLEEAI